MLSCLYVGVVDEKKSDILVRKVKKLSMVSSDEKNAVRMPLKSMYCIELAS